MRSRIALRVGRYITVVGVQTLVDVLADDRRAEDAGILIFIAGLAGAGEASKGKRVFGADGVGLRSTIRRC